jgi:hypothetical protein
MACPAFLNAVFIRWFPMKGLQVAMVAGLNPQQGRQRNPAYGPRQFNEYGNPYFYLRLYWETGCHQCFKATQNRVDPLETIFQHQERRPGARIFSRSGTVNDVPGFFIQSRQVRLNFPKGYAQRSPDMAGSVLLWRPDVEQDRPLVLHRLLNFRYS